MSNLMRLKRRAHVQTVAALTERIQRNKKPDTGDPLHTQEPVTVASFRTWRGWRECVARDRCLTYSILTPDRTLPFYGGIANNRRSNIYDP